MLCTSVIFDDHSLIVSALSGILTGQVRRSTKGCFRMGRVWFFIPASRRLTVPDRPGIEILLILRWGCQHSSYGIMDALKLSTGFKFPLPSSDLLIFLKDVIKIWDAVLPGCLQIALAETSQACRSRSTWMTLCRHTNAAACSARPSKATRRIPLSSNSVRWSPTNTHREQAP